MNENHWYPRDPQRWLTDTAWCDQATEVAHNRLTDTYYALGKPIKDDPSRIQLVGKIKDVDYVRVTGCLMELGWRIENGEWRHRRIEETMAESEENRLKKIAQVKAATDASLKARAERNGQRNVERNVERQLDGNSDNTGKPSLENLTLCPKSSDQNQKTDEKERNVERNAQRNVERNVNLTTTTTTVKTAGDIERLADYPELPSWEAVKAHAARIGLVEWKALDWFNEMEGCGWLDYHKRQIRKWSSVLDRVRTRWEADGRPLKQPGIKSPQTEIKTSPGVTSFVQHKELERVSERMKTIKATYSGHQTWAEDDIEEFRKLRDRKNELKAILGVKL